jgi:hypothetical protein
MNQRIAALSKIIQMGLIKNGYNMKKVFVIALTLIMFALAFNACTSIDAFLNKESEATTSLLTENTTNKTTETTESETNEITTLSITATNTTNPTPTYPKEYIPGSIKLSPEETPNDMVPYKMSYRRCWYGISSNYMNLVEDSEEKETFFENAEKKGGVFYPYEESKKMPLVAFVKYFKIPKEYFIEATEEIKEARQKMEHDIMSEEYEIPNADIIYTFDDDIINNYYRRQ